MNYMDKIDAWFSAELAQFIAKRDIEKFRKAVKDKILESYRNGQRAKRSKRKVEPSPKQK